MAHVGFADPYCPELSKIILTAAGEVAKEEQFQVHAGGTYVCMEGPLFSTRAESNLYRSWGAKIIGMTNVPEARLAREAEIAYATLALVTDYDCWKADGHDVEVVSIQKIIAQNSARAKKIVAKLGSLLKVAPPSKIASKALDFSIITPKEHVSAATRARLGVLLKRVWES